MEKAAGMIEIHIAILLFGFAGLFGKLVTAPAPVIVLGRTFFAFVVLSGVIWVLKKDFRPRSSRDLAAFFLLGALLAGHWIAFFHAIQVSSVAVGLFAFSTFPLFVTFMEPVFFKENLRRIDVLTAVLVVTGLWCIVPNPDPANRITQGVAWGVIAGISFAVLSILNRRYAPAYSPLVIAGFQNGVAAVFLVPVCAFMDFSLTLKEGVLLAVLGIFCTAFAHALFIRSLRFIRTQLAGVITGLEPVYGAIFAFLILGERPGIRTLVGGTLIVGAVMIGTVLRASSPPHET